MHRKASSVIKNELSIALSCPQNRTARRVASKMRLALGKFSAMFVTLKTTSVAHSLRLQSLVFPNEFIDPLEARHDVLQSAMQNPPVGSAGMEARDRPSPAVGVIDDWNDNNPQRSLAI